MVMRRVRTPMPDSIEVPPLWHRRAALAAGVLVLSLVLVCVRSTTTTSAAADDHGRYHDRTFRVAHVVDGDTLDIAAPDGSKAVTRIRLWGVDSPEVARGQGAGAHYGTEATAYAERTLAGRDVHVVLSQRRTRGKYGRLLAYVFLDRGGRMFNEMLLETGHAYADLRFRHDYEDRFESLEREARKAGAGLWADVTLDTMPEWKQRFERRKSEGGG